MTARDRDEERFWRTAERVLQLPGVTRSTMMGLPCLRVNEAFFASWDRATGALLVKLPAVEVDRLVTSGKADSFAPAARRFREWASIPASRVRAWPQLLERALDHVSTLPSKPTRKQR
jgi:hypothetical protein